MTLFGPMVPEKAKEDPQPSKFQLSSCREQWEIIMIIRISCRQRANAKDPLPQPIDAHELSFRLLRTVVPTLMGGACLPSITGEKKKTQKLTPQAWHAIFLAWEYYVGMILHMYMRKSSINCSWKNPGGSILISPSISKQIIPKKDTAEGRRILAIKVKPRGELSNYDICNYVWWSTKWNPSSLLLFISYDSLHYLSPKWRLHPRTVGHL